MKILALIFDGFEEEEATAPFALLRRAKADLTIASNNTTVVGNHNIAYTNITSLNEVNFGEYGCLIIPGGPHYKFLRESQLVHNIITHFITNNKIVCAICAAPTIIGDLGFLRGKNYTCFTSMNKDFGGTYMDSGVVVDGNLITAKSVAYSLDFAYAIIEKVIGRDVLESVWEKIYYEK